MRQQVQATGTAVTRVSPPNQLTALSFEGVMAKAATTAISEEDLVSHRISTEARIAAPSGEPVPAPAASGSVD